MASTFTTFTSPDVDQVVFSWRFARMSTAARKDNADRSFYSTNFQITSSIWKHNASSFFPTKLALRLGLALNTLRSPSSDKSRMFLVCAKQTPISWQNSVGLWQRCFFMLPFEFGLPQNESRLLIMFGDTPESQRSLSRFPYQILSLILYDATTTSMAASFCSQTGAFQLLMTRVLWLRSINNFLRRCSLFVASIINRWIKGMTAIDTFEEVK